MMKKISSFLILAVFVLCLTACGGAKEIGPRDAVESSELQFTLPEEGDPIAIIQTSMGEIHVALYPDLAPMAVDNFIGLSQQGYYNGAIFHKVVYGSYIQTGDATGTGNGSSTIWNADGFPLEATDTLRHYTGALCVAFDKDSKEGTSQFYFVTTLEGNVPGSMINSMESAGYSAESIEAYKAAGGLPQLDNTDTVFGQIYQGQSVADAISCVKVDDNGKPIQNVTITGITITTYTPPAPDATPAPEE